MKKVIVGSSNPVKVEAVRLGFSRVWPEETWEVAGAEVSSGVADQPMSPSESLRGARQRAAGALAAAPESDFAVGLEGGLEQREELWFDSGWVVIRDQAGTEGVGTTLRMITPPAMMKHIQAGMELGHVDDLVFGDDNSKQGKGHFGLMTGGALIREAAYADGVVVALARWLHPDLWEQAAQPRVTICGSIAFYEYMLTTAEILRKSGIAVDLPPEVVADGDGTDISVQQYYSLRKAAGDKEAWVWSTKAKAMQAHFDKVAASNAILVLNYEKNGVAGYVGANTLMEMGLALHLGKPIFLLNPVPALPYTEEILGMQPHILDGDVAQLPRLLPVRQVSSFPVDAGSRPA